MKEDLLSQKGLSLERLQTLLKVARAGSIVSAADGDPVRQSQYSRQIKELEQFFNVALFSKSGRSIELTDAGRELSRVSRYFMLALTKLAKGYASDAPGYRVGGVSEIIAAHVLPQFKKLRKAIPGLLLSTEIVTPDEAITRVWDLGLDFAVIPQMELPRQIDSQVLAEEALVLCSAKRISAKMPIAATARHSALVEEAPGGKEVSISCATEGEVLQLIQAGDCAGYLPERLAEGLQAKPTGIREQYLLIWNRRLLRLDPKAEKVIRALA